MSIAGALSITLEDQADEPIYEPGLGETPLWQATRVTGLFDADCNSLSIAADVMMRAGISAEQLRWHTVEDKDWEREWMRHYEPIHCAPGFWICPSWTPAPEPDAVNLLLDPGLAFGTGTHPTTFMCLQWLAAQQLHGTEVLDYGCGSGILGIASLLLGAKFAEGIDIDAQALLASRDNALRNGLADEAFPVHLPQHAPQRQYSLVVANILAGPLVELAPTLLSRIQRGGLLCLSGILASQEADIIAAYTHAIDFAKTQRSAEWVCLSGRLRSDYRS